MGCAFCASTLGGFKRSLSAGEILSQVYLAQRETGERISHIVLMGMGEPMDNFDNVMRFITLVTDEKGLNHARTRMSFMIETPYAKEKMTAKENLEKQRLQKGIPDKKRIEEVLRAVNLEDTGRKKVKNFSLGMRQRLGLANALLGKPDFMVLDEPINGLDPEGIVEIRELFRRLNKEDNITLVISSHILSELSLLCTDYVFINKGRIRGTFTEEELRTACSEYVQINTDNNEKASSILINKCGIEKMDVLKESGIRIYEKLDEIKDISKILYDNGVVPTEIAKNAVSLEDYYMRMVSEV